MAPKRFSVGEKVIAPRAYGHFEPAEVLRRHTGTISMTPPKPGDKDDKWAVERETRPTRDELGDYLVRFGDGHVVRANESELLPATASALVAAA